MDTNSMFDKPMTQLLKESEKTSPIKIMPDKEIEFSESITDEDLNKFIEKTQKLGND